MSLSYAALALALLVASTGCVAASEPVTSCMSSTDCPSGYVCTDRLCQPAARPDASADAAIYSGDALVIGSGDAAVPTSPGTSGAGTPDAALPVDPTAGPCTAGASEACTTTCGTMGTRSCTALGWTLCGPPAETCNGVDDDCDGMADESVTRSCANACGAGVEACVGGIFQACNARTPTAEVCNNLDDDCDGAVDEAVTRACTTMCGAGSEMCVAGAFTGCVGRMPTTETCNNVDDDCNGATDDGLFRNCSTACGAGQEVCSGGAFGACSARTPTGEACNRVDDDCNGVIDDGMRVSMQAPSIGTLAAFHPDCNTAGNAGTIFCNSAANRFCATTCGGRSGLVVEASGSATVTMCVGVDTVATTFGALAARHPSCNLASSSTIFCASATHRECQARGYASGIGLLETDGTNVTIACMRGFDGSQQTPTARTAVINTAFSRLDDFVPSCTNGNASSFGCRSAAHRLCNAGGYTSGFGPVEGSGDSATIICVNP